MTITLIVTAGLAFYFYRQVGELRRRLDRAENEIDVLLARTSLRQMSPTDERRAAPGDVASPPRPDIQTPSGQTPSGQTPSGTTTPQPPSEPPQEAGASGAVPSTPAPRPPRRPETWTSPPVTADAPIEPATVSGASLEETIGTRWAVYAGGLALALGSIFLVNYTIEQGLIGPGARIVLGLLLAAVLVGGGEWFRRTDKRLGFNDTAEAHIPSILTAAGTVAAFATIYAAYALYGFIGSAVAFLALGAVGLATLLAAALHGPALAGLGIAGSYATPALVASSTPNPWPLVVYLAAVAIAALLLARLRTWAWLAGSTVAGAVLWGFVMLEQATRPLHHPQLPPPTIDPVTGTATYAPPLPTEPLSGWLEATYLHSGLQLLLAAALIAIAPYVARGARTEIDGPAHQDWVAAACLAGHAFLSLAILTSIPATDTGWSIYAAVTITILAATAYAATPAAAVAPLASLLVVLTAFVWPADRAAVYIEPFASLGPLLGFPTQPAAYLAFAALGALVPAAVSIARLWRAKPLDVTATALYALAATGGPLLVLIIAYVRAGELEASTTYMSAAFLLSGAYAFLSEMFFKMVGRVASNAVRGGVQGAYLEIGRLEERASDAARNASGIFAAASVGALAIGLVAITDRQYLAAALAIAALAAAWITSVRSLPLLRYAVAAIGVIVAARLLLDPVLFGLNLGTTPIVNGLLLVYGVPAAAFSGAAWLLRKSHAESGSAPDFATHLSDGLALLLASLLAFFEIRHLTNDGDVLSATSGHVEQGLMALTALGLSQVAARLSRDIRSVVFDWAAYAFSGLALLFAVIGLGFANNPYFSAEPVIGPIVFDSLLLAYAAPGLMALYLARVSRGVRPELFVRLAAIAGIALVFLYVNLEVRHIFQGESIHGLRRTGNAEIWGYTVAWLGLAIALLTYGLWRHLTTPRIASAALIVAAALKVVLIDLAGVSGIWRALSFLCLGAVLIGIGLVYQRLIFAPRKPD